MNSTVLVSIIIPVYNTEAYLGECLKSVLNQTHSNIEVLAINDGSSDNSLSLLKEFAEYDSRIHLIDQANQGVSSARNIGLDKAKGSYIAFLDSDDLYHPQFIEILLTEIIKADSDIACCEIETFKESTRPHFSIHKDPYSCTTVNNVLKRALIKKKPYPTVTLWNKLYKAQIIQLFRFNPELVIGEDWEFMFRLLNLCDSSTNVSLPLVYYRVRLSSATHCKLSDKFIDNQLLGVDSLQHYYSNRSKSLELTQKLNYLLTNTICKLCIVTPYKKSKDKTDRFHFWEKYSTLLIQLQQKGTFRADLLPFRKRLWVYLLINKHFNILSFILKF